MSLTELTRIKGSTSAISVEGSDELQTIAERFTNVDQGFGSLPLLLASKTLVAGMTATTKCQLIAGDNLGESYDISTVKGDSYRDQILQNGLFANHKRDIGAEKKRSEVTGLYGAINNRKGGIFAGLTFIGDSITAGTYGSEERSWAEQINFSYMKANKLNNIGFRSVQETDVTSIHKVVLNGTWLQPSDEDSYTNCRVVSNTVNDTMIITPAYPTYAIRVGFVQGINETSTFKIEQAGAVPITITHTGVDKYNQISDYMYTKNSVSPITITVISGYAQITGIYYIESGSDPMSLIFAKGGRSVTGTSIKAIDEMLSASSGTIIWSMGYNDQFSTDTALHQAVFVKLDHFFSEAKRLRRPVIVNDFIWVSPESHWLREKYIEIAGEYDNVTLISHPNMLYHGSDNTSNSYRQVTLGMWSDSAHPNDVGYDWVAENVRRVMGLPDGEDYRLSKLAIRPNTQIGTGDPVEYRSVLPRSALARVSNTNGKLVIDLGVTSFAQFFWSFSLDISTYSRARVGTLRISVYWDGTAWQELQAIASADLVGLEVGVDIELVGGVVGSNMALAINPLTGGDTWGYPTAIIRDSLLSLVDVNKLSFTQEVRVDVLTTFA